MRGLGFANKAKTAGRKVRETMRQPDYVEPDEAESGMGRYGRSVSGASGFNAGMEEMRQPSGKGVPLSGSQAGRGRMVPGLPYDPEDGGEEGPGDNYGEEEGTYPTWFDSEPEDEAEILRKLFDAGRSGENYPDIGRDVTQKYHDAYVEGMRAGGYDNNEDEFDDE